MRRRTEWLAVGIGVAATATAAYLALRGDAPAPFDAGPGGLAWLVGLGGLAVGVWLLYAHTRSRTPDDPVPWSDSGPIVEETPEAVPQHHPLSGTDLVAALQEASVAARDDRDVERGLAVVRPLLRTVYREAAVTGGQDPAAVEAALDAGTWTDDPVAAAVCSPEVDLPTRSLWGRLKDWLYPARATTRATVRAVGAIEAAADDLLPAVIGSDAPRKIPTYEGSLAVREVGPDGPGHRQRPHEDAAASGDRSEVSEP